MTLNWTPYIGWTVVRYEVFLSIDNGAYTFFQNVDGDSLSMDQFSIVENRRYCYYVEAVRSDGIRSSSNTTYR